jgi:CBS-domain-containing membrane protein
MPAVGRAALPADDNKEKSMLIQDLMTRNVRTCRSYESLNAAAQKMWEADIGAIPVLDDKQRVVGMVTDRDISMAAYTQGRPLCQILIAESMSKSVVTCAPTDTVARAEQLMRDHAIRRLPVVDEHRHVIGIVSMNDLARAVSHQHRGQAELVATMAAICQPRHTAPAPS